MSARILAASRAALPPVTRNTPVEVGAPLPNAQAKREPWYASWALWQYIGLVVPHTWYYWVFLFFNAWLIAALNGVCATQAGELFNAIEKKGMNIDEEMRWSALFFAGAALLVFVNKCGEEALAAKLRKISVDLLYPLFCRHRRGVAQYGDACAEAADQTLTDFLKSVAQKLITYSVIACNSSLSLYYFAPRLHELSPGMLWLAIGYGILGSGIAYLIGIPLSWLQKKSFAAESSLRNTVNDIKKGNMVIATKDGKRVIAIKKGKRIIAIKEGSSVESEALRCAAVATSAQYSLVLWNALLAAFNSLFDFGKQIAPLLIVVPIYFTVKGMGFGIISEMLVCFAFVATAVSTPVREMPGLRESKAMAHQLGVLWHRLKELQERSN